MANEDFFKVWYLREMTPRDILEKGLVEGKAIYKHDELHEIVAYDQGSPPHFAPVFRLF